MYARHQLDEEAFRVKVTLGPPRVQSFNCHNQNTGKMSQWCGVCGGLFLQCGVRVRGCVRICVPPEHHIGYLCLVLEKIYRLIYALLSRHACVNWPFTGSVRRRTLE